MLSEKSNEDYQLTTKTTPTNLLLHLTSSNQLPEKSIYKQKFELWGMMNIKLYTKLNDTKAAEGIKSAKPV